MAHLTDDRDYVREYHGRLCGARDTLNSLIRLSARDILHVNLFARQLAQGPQSVLSQIEGALDYLLGLMPPEDRERLGTK